MKKGKVHYYCDCPRTEAEKKRVKTSSARISMKETQIDTEGLCTNCGHYPVALREKLDSHKSLYNRLFGSEFDDRARKDRKKYTKYMVEGNGKGNWVDYYEEYRIGN